MIFKRQFNYFIFFICIITPSFTVSLGAPSMAYGLMLVASVFILVALIKTPISNLFQDMRKMVFIAIGLLALMLMHGLFVLILMHDLPFNGARFLLSTICLLVVLISIVFLLYYVKKIEVRYFDSAINFVFIALVLVLILTIFVYQPSLGHSKAMLFFSEPSHLALVIAPFMLYVVLKTTLNRKIFILLFIFNLALVIQNLTLIFVVVLACFFLMRLSSILAIFLLMALSLYINPIVTRQLYLAGYSTNISQQQQHPLDYIADRLPNLSKPNGGNSDTINSVVRNSKNGSLLASVSGWQRAYFNLVDSKGLGFGFQQFGVNGRWGSATNKLKELYGYPLCHLDGGSVAPKFVGEFGIVGIILLIIYVVIFLKIILFIRRINANFFKSIDFIDLFFICCFLSYSVSLFIRGVGYFSEDSFLFLASVFWFLQPEKLIYLRSILNIKERQ